MHKSLKICKAKSNEAERLVNPQVQLETSEPHSQQLTKLLGRKQQDYQSKEPNQPLGPS